MNLLPLNYTHNQSKILRLIIYVVAHNNDFVVLKYISSSEGKDAVGLTDHLECSRQREHRTESMWENILGRVTVGRKLTCLCL